MPFKKTFLYLLCLLFLSFPLSSFAKPSPSSLYMRRAEFVTALVKEFHWKLERPKTGSFLDNKIKSKSYYAYIETANHHQVLNKSQTYFRPNDYITREETAVMLIKALGYESMTKQIDFSPTVYKDITRNAEYLLMTLDFGFMTATSKVTFSPLGKVKKTEALSILKRIRNKLNQKIDTLHGFYAFNAYSQKDFIKNLSSVGFCWSSLQFDADSQKAILNLSKSNQNDFSLPSGFSEPIKLAQKSKTTTYLNIYASQSNKVTMDESTLPLGLIDFAVQNTDTRKDLIHQIISALNQTTYENESVSFDGVVIDFEDLRRPSRSNYISFLKELRETLVQNHKKLMVAVQPARNPKEIYFDGYDFRAIGEIADYVILMAHDYHARNLTAFEMNTPNPDTPLTPISEIYYALKAVTDKTTGIKDVNKIMLQLSFGSAQWQSREGKVINQKANTPTYQQIMNRYINADEMSDVVRHYSKQLENPWLTYYNSKDDVSNKIWYEDVQSVEAKIRLAKMFGVHRLSLWRLGNVPSFEDNAGKIFHLDVWQQIQKYVKIKNK